MRARGTLGALAISAAVHVVAGVLLVRVEVPPVARVAPAPTRITVVTEMPRRPAVAERAAEPVARSDAPAARASGGGGGRAVTSDDAVRAARDDAARADAARTAREEAARADAARIAREEAARADADRDAARSAPPGTGDPRVTVPRTLDLTLHADPTPRRDGPGRGSSGDIPGDDPGPPRPGLPDGLQPVGGGNYRFEDHGFIAEIDHDGTVHFADRVPVGIASPTSIRFDVTEAVMMMRGDDPYRPQKMRFLEQTRELRAKLCGAAHTERLRRALRLLPGELERVWRDDSRTLAERRRLLFERWDECADNREEAETARMGALARATVLAFIRRTIPAGSPGAYTEAELVALNARRVSRESFSPY